MLIIDWKALLAAYGLTIKDLSDQTGISYNKLHHMINGGSEYISLKTAGRVLLTLGIPVMPPFYLVEGDLDEDTAHSTPKQTMD